MATCPQCGVEVMEGAVFCHRCGASVEDGPDEAAELATDTHASAPEQPTTAQERSTPERFKGIAAARQAAGDDQEVELWEGDYSAKAMMGTWIAAGLISIAAIVAAVLLAGGDPVAWAVTLGAIGVLWVAVFLLLLYRQHSVHYRLTNQRLIHERGLLSRVTDRIEVIDIDDITFSQGLVERMMNVGTIRITSSDRTHPEMTLPGIENVRDVSTLMDDARRQERRRRGLHIEAV